MTPKPYKSSRFRSVVAIRRVIDVAQMLPEEKLGEQPRNPIVSAVKRPIDGDEDNVPALVPAADTIELLPVIRLVLHNRP